MPSGKELRRQAELDIVARAKKKAAAHEPLSQKELYLLTKYEEEETLEAGMAFMQACPKRHIAEQCHTSIATLHRLADTADCQELRKKEPNLWVVLERLIRFPGEYKTKTGRNVNGGAYAPGSKPHGEGTVIDTMLFGDEDAEWQQKCFEEKYYALRDQRLIRQGELLPSEVIHDAHTRWAAVLRDVGHKLALEYGNDAQSVLSQGIDDCVRIIEDVLNDWKSSRAIDDEPETGSQAEHEDASGAGPPESEASEDSLPSFLR